MGKLATKIIVQLDGGLGNQLFQYAFLRQLIIDIKNPVVSFDLFTLERNQNITYQRPFRLNSFKVLTFKIANHNEVLLAKSVRWFQRIFGVYKWNCINEKDNSFKIKNRNYIVGYWLNKKYVSKAENFLRKELILSESISNSKFYSQILTTNSISLHIRQGDFVTDEINSQIYTNLMKTDYYINALDRINNRVTNPTFFIFSDNIKWCINNFSNVNFDIRYVDDTNSELEDFFLMQKCKHNIIANSTFSWWAAWLNSNPQKNVICPTNWYLNGINDPDIFLDEWIKL